jgi:hypothetical protein
MCKAWPTSSRTAIAAKGESGQRIHEGGPPWGRTVGHRRGHHGTDILNQELVLHRAPQQIADTLHLDSKLVEDIINKVDRNEYKRQQAAPGLKVTTKAFGIGRRFPIAQRFSG